MQNRSLSQSLKVQGIIGLILLAVFAFFGLWASALYGLFIGLVNVILLGLTFQRANEKAAEDPKSGILILYLSAVIRFVLLAVLFVLGLSLLKLDPMAVVLTFVLMQAGQMFNLKGKRRLTD
ncbi:ATP synthase subunit I [Hydrogenovibrio kuenenii]|uniref:ATP synthase subunit I n=1 Tax=Hydrogenovibrio kuenenii TaxID=63658 RepID=UPI000467B4F1|nr:ATP synthase subunit I [Hydrogenovibrio kuenenii]